MITYLLKLGKLSIISFKSGAAGASPVVIVFSHIIIELKVNILCLPVINQIPSATFPDTPCQLLLSRYHLYVHVLIIRELID